MTEKEHQQLIEAVEKTIDSKINGKIDKIKEILEKQNEKQEEFNKRVCEHITRVEPYLQGAMGLGIIWKVFILVGSTAVAYLAVKSAFFRI